MRERAVPIGKVGSFGSVTSWGTVAKYLSEEERDTVIWQTMQTGIVREARKA